MCLFSVSAFGLVGGEIHYKWWKNPKIIQEMDLTDDQVDAIEDIFKSYREQIIDSQKELKKEEAHLLDVLRQPECSSDEVMQITDHIEDMRADLTRIKVEMLLKIKNVLTSEQEETLHNIRERYRGGRAR
jgi:Spy/CpxP family protein refolding chaperone